jgi:hypothetical protein
MTANNNVEHGAQSVPASSSKHNTSREGLYVTRSMVSGAVNTAAKYHGMSPEKRLSPAICHARIEPWVFLANSLGTPVWESVAEGGQRRSFPETPTAERLYAALPRSVADAIELHLLMPDHAPQLYRRVVMPDCVAQVFQLALHVGRALHYLADVSERHGFFEARKYRQWDDSILAAYGMSVMVPVGFEVRGTGRIHTKFWNPYPRFNQALEVIEAGRLRRCPACGKLFYAKRTSQWADTPACNHVRHERLRRRRQNKYELARKLKS